MAVAGQVKQPVKKGRPFPAVGEFVRIIDPVTENIVVRLTALTSSSLLPQSRGHFVSARERVLIFSSNRTGHFAPYQIDLRTGVIRQLADADKLNPRSVCLDRLEKSVYYLDGDSLFEVNLTKGLPHKIGEGFTAFSQAADGSLYVISSGKLKHISGKSEQVLADDASDLWPQPNARGCLFSRAVGAEERALYYVASEGNTPPILLASGRVREPYWDKDGETILFLRDVTIANGTVLTEIHAKSIHAEDEFLVSPTSQFASFAPNTDASVFVGASRSRAQPTILLMLRTPHREMTLCEHKSSHPAQVSPVFSPDNRRVYFESDREGHSAIYSVNVELLVEPPSTAS